jgi:hypothetical protein
MKLQRIYRALLVLPLCLILPGCPKFPIIYFAPTSLTFAPLVVDPSGGARASQLVTVHNSGQAPGNIGALSVSGSYGMTSNCPGSLAAGASCTIDVSFAPNRVGAINGQIMRSGAGVVSLAGVGLAPVGFSPESLDFGTVAIGAASAAKAVTLTNNQSTALAISGIAASGDYSQSNNCSPSLAAGASCTLNVTFHPTAKGKIPGALTVSSDAALAAQPVGLSGVGSGSANSQAAFSPTSLTFGNQEAGTASASQTVTLSNASSSSSLTVQSITASGNYSETNTCTAPVAPNGTCSITVTFQPTANLVPISYPGAITVVASDAASPHVIGLSGAGVTPVVASPASLDFGVVNRFANSDPQTVTLTNVDPANEDIALTVTSPYTTANNSCTASVASGGSCSADVTIFWGTNPPRSLNGALTYTFSSGGFLSPQIVNLSGCVTDVKRTPTKLNFGAVPAGQTSATETVALSGGPFNFSGFTLSGSNASEFAIANNTCSSQVAGSCTVDLTFTPAASGPKAATLQIADNGLCSPQPVSLVGGSSAGPFVITGILAGTGNGAVISDPPGLDCPNSACSASFAAGTTVTLTATPDSGGVPPSTFIGWSGACSGTGTCTLTLTADRQMRATFDALPRLTVGVGTNLSGSGSVTSTPAGIDCPTTECQAFFLSGSSVTLTASPGSGSTFTGWSNGPCSGTGTCVVTMNGEQHVDATFNGPPTLVVNLGGPGTGTVTSTPAGINCPGTCQATFPPNTAVALAAAVSGTNTFGGWGSPCSGTGTCSITMNADQTVDATFFTGPPDFTPTIGPSTAQTVTAGGTANFTFTFNAINGLTGTVALACHSASTDKGVNCRLSSSSVPLGGTATLSVTTRGPSAGLAPPTGLFWISPVVAAWMPLLGLALVGAGSAGRRSRRRKLLLLFVAVLGLVLLQVACGGSSSSSSNQTVTPPGTYLVTVDETAGATKHTSTVTVFVR